MSLKEMQAALEASLEQPTRKPRTARPRPLRQALPSSPVTVVEATEAEEGAPPVEPTSAPDRLAAVEERVDMLSAVGEAAVGQLHVLQGGAQEAAKKIVAAQKTTSALAITAIVASVTALAVGGYVYYRSTQKPKRYPALDYGAPVVSGLAIGFSTGRKFGPKAGVGAGLAAATIHALITR